MISLEVIAVSFGQFQTGAYTVLLKEETGQRKIPVTIGTPEAHSIVLVLKGLKPPRPMTHDLFVSFARALNTTLQQVNIYKQIEGIFYSELIFDRGEKQLLRLETRTSDAIALALRFQVPVLTTEEIIQQTGILLLDENEDEMEDSIVYSSIKKTTLPLESMNINELQRQLKEAIEKENYEKAACLRDLIQKKQQS